MDVYYKMAKRLDAMTRSVTSREANILDRVLKTLKDEEDPLTDKDKAAIEKMYQKYFGKDEKEEDKDDEEEEEDDDEEPEDIGPIEEPEETPPGAD